MALAAIVAGCAKGPTSVTVSPSSVSLTEGESATLTASVLPEGASYSGIVWSSSNEGVAMVSSSGKVMAVAPGSATVTASADGVSGSASVTVTAKIFAVTGVSLNQSNLSMVVGDKATLTATVAPDNATDKSVTWRSSDPAVASVDGGSVTALAPGEATVTVTTTDGVKTASCSISVKAKYVAVESVALDYAELDIYEGSTATLKATVLPADATEPDLSWASTDERVCTVEDGVLTAIKPGTVTIRARAKSDFYKFAECRVTVKPITVESMAFAEENITMKEGETRPSGLTFTPANATLKDVRYEYSASGIARIDDDGTLTALKAGKTRILAILLSDETIQCACYVTVEQDDSLKGIALDLDQMTITVGESKTLTVAYTPEYAANKTVTWASSDPAVATVADGVVTAVALGQATVTATAQEGGWTASCLVSVEEKGDPDVYFIYERYLYKNGQKTDEYATQACSDGHNLYTSTNGKGWFQITKNGVSTRIQSGHDSYWNEGHMYANNGTVYLLGEYSSSSSDKTLVEISPSGEVRDYIIRPEGAASIVVYSQAFGPAGELYLGLVAADEYRVKSAYIAKLQGGKVTYTRVVEDINDYCEIAVTSSGDVYLKTALRTAENYNDNVVFKNGVEYMRYTGYVINPYGLVARGNHVYMAMITANSAPEDLQKVLIFKDFDTLYDITYNNSKYYFVDGLKVDSADNVYSAVVYFDSFSGSTRGHKCVVMQGDHVLFKCDDNVEYYTNFCIVE